MINMCICKTGPTPFSSVLPVADNPGKYFEKCWKKQLGNHHKSSVGFQDSSINGFNMSHFDYND